MINNKSKYIFKIFIAVFLTLGISISLQSILANWEAPSSDPPGGVQEVLDIGTDYQHKFGTMSIGGIGSTTQGFALQVDSGDVDVIDGRVGVGVNADSNYQVEVDADDGEEGVRIISALNWSPLNIRNSGDSSDLFRVNQDGDIKAGNTIYKDDDGNVVIKMGNN